MQLWPSCKLSNRWGWCSESRSGSERVSSCDLLKDVDGLADLSAAPGAASERRSRSLGARSLAWAELAPFWEV